MLDEILGNETELEILEHTTDTAGYTDLVFALFDLLGLEFTPRLRDIGDQKLSKIKGLDVAYPTFQFTGQVNPEYLARHWEGLVRVASSLKLGYVTSSLFIHELQAYPPSASTYLRLAGIRAAGENHIHPPLPIESAPTPQNQQPAQQRGATARVA